MLLMPVATIENYIKQAWCSAPVRRSPISGSLLGDRRRPVPDVSLGGAARRYWPRRRSTATPSGAQSDNVIKRRS